MLVFAFRTFDLARGWFGMFVVFPSRGSPISGICKFILRVGEIPAAKFGLREGKIPATESGSHVLPSGRNLSNRAVKRDSWRGNPRNITRSSSGENPTSEQNGCM